MYLCKLHLTSLVLTNFNPTYIQTHKQGDFFISWSLSPWMSQALSLVTYIKIVPLLKGHLQNRFTDLWLGSSPSSNFSQTDTLSSHWLYGLTFTIALSPLVFQGLVLLVGLTSSFKVMQNRLTLNQICLTFVFMLGFI